MTKDTLRNEIEKIQLDLVEKTANPTTKWEDVIPEATSQILSLLEGREREARASVEIYVPVRGYEGLYEVSNLGNIRSIARGRNTGRVLKQCKQFRNYLAVSLCKNNVSKSNRVHRIVAEAFISNPEGKRTVNHKDGDPTNNNINNLEWATYSEQELHSYAVLGKVNANHPDRLAELESE